MGKVIQFPKMIQEEVEEVIVPDINSNQSTKIEEEKIGVDVVKYVKIKPIEQKPILKKKEKKVRKNLVLTNIFKFISKIKLKNKVALGLIAIAIISVSMVKAESKENSNAGYSYIESFNMDMAKELSNEVGDGIKETSAQEDIVVTINPTIEGEEFAIYTATVDVVLKASDIKVKDGEKTFKIKDVEINVLDVSPELNAEDMAILPEDSIKVIAKESAKLAKKLEKELKKEDKYIEELIKSKM